VGDLLLVLAALTPQQRRLFRDLMTPHKGVVAALLPQSIRSFFAKSLQPVQGSTDNSQLVFVDSQLVRVAVEAIVAPDGQLVADTGSDALFASMRSREQTLKLVAGEPSGTGLSPRRRGAADAVLRTARSAPAACACDVPSQRVRLTFSAAQRLPRVARGPCGAMRVAYQPRPARRSMLCCAVSSLCVTRIRVV
jgi:hypothetical protein